MNQKTFNRQITKHLQMQIQIYLYICKRGFCNYTVCFDGIAEEEATWIAAKSPMDLDNVKRLFSNNKYADVVGQVCVLDWLCDYISSF